MSLSKEKSYHFADFIRFVAMCAIIFQHSFIVERSVLATDFNASILFYALKVAAKIGSISFFAVSGYLLSAALERYTSKEYLNKRVKNIFKPYILFVLLYLILDSAGAFFGQQRISTISELPAFVVSKIGGILFFTSYWFIFNYFISVFILLALRRYLYSPVFGLVLLLCTLTYSINAHFEWFPPHHTTAFLGFTFFLWLGANLKKNEQIFWPFVNKIQYWKIITIVLITFALDMLETYWLMKDGATVVDSSLKFTNILYALSVFVLLTKVGQGVKFGFLNPRDETYPLYLVHPIFLKVINYAILPMFPAVAGFLWVKDPSRVTWLVILVYQIGWFLVIYTMSLITVKLILNSRLKWMFGKQNKEYAPSVKLQGDELKN
jgi:probable poly-beta-1,6-N-acetyl-D-glucosamine export protein